MQECEVEPPAEGLALAPYYIPRRGGVKILNDAGDLAAVVHLSRDQTAIRTVRVRGRADIRSEANVKRALKLCADTAHRLAREKGHREG